MRTIIVSGVSRGLGQAIFDCLIEHDARPIGIGRIFAAHHLAGAGTGQYKLVRCDLSAVDQVTAIDLSAVVWPDTTGLVFVSNAGVVEPVSRIGHLSEREICASVMTNILSPILLTNKLADMSEQRGLRLRIVNITSGAANRPVIGWSAYCTGKAAARYFFECLIAERPDVGVSNIDPGVLDTDMQRSIRLSSEKAFPQRLHFERLYQDGRLQDPAEVAREIVRKEALI